MLQTLTGEIHIIISCLIKKGRKRDTVHTQKTPKKGRIRAVANENLSYYSKGPDEEQRYDTRNRQAIRCKNTNADIHHGVFEEASE